MQYAAPWFKISFPSLCFRRVRRLSSFTGFTALLLLFLVLSAVFAGRNVIQINGSAIQDYIRTTPSLFFKVYEFGSKGIMLRTYNPPIFYNIDQAKREQWHRPIPELRRAPSPSSYTCQKEQSNPLVFIGVFTTAQSVERRHLLRLHQEPETTTSAEGGVMKVEYKFIIGQPKQLQDRQLLQDEMEIHDDIVLLDQEENMNEGKSYAFVQWLAKRPGPKPRFLFKVDDDAIVVTQNLVTLLQDLDCNDLYYFGSCTSWSCGLSLNLPPYFGGHAYGLSAPLYEWLGNANLPRNATTGIEDVRTGSYLLNLDNHDTRRLKRLNLDGQIALYWWNWYRNKWAFRRDNLVALHHLKTKEEFELVKEEFDAWLG